MDKGLDGLRFQSNGRVQCLYVATHNTRTMSTDYQIQAYIEATAKIKADVIGICETRRNEKLIAEWHMGDQIFLGKSFCNGSKVGGVGFIVKKQAVHLIESCSILSPRTAVLVLHLDKKRTLKIIQVYAPATNTTQSAEEAEEELEGFFEEVERAVNMRSTYTIVQGDFNAKVGCRIRQNERCIGIYGIGTRNDHGSRLITFAIHKAMRIVVIGAAPTGLGVAYRLNELQQSGNDEAKNIELIVLEKQSYAGGLSCTITDEKGFLWDMGTHVTFSHNFPYYDDAVKWAVDEWNHLKRNCQVDMNRMFNEEGLHLVPYPLQYSVLLFPKEIKASCLKELKERYEMEHIEAPNNFDEWTLNHFGPTIRHYFFRPYTRKLWTVETDKMNSVWVGTRVAKLPQTKLEELCAMSKQELNADFGWGPNVVFTYPKYGGTGAIWNAMAAKLSQKWFRFNCEVTKVNAKDKRLTYVKKEENGNEQTNVIDYDILINSSPIDLLVKNLNLRIELNLQHNKVYIVGVGMKLPMPEFIKSFSWLYFPDPAVPFYRVTVFSNYGEVTPDNAKYWSLICECATNPSDPTTKEEMGKLAVNGLIKKSFIERQQIVSIYSTVLDYGYPIPSLKRDSELARAHKILEEHDIYSRGRFGGWKYEASYQDHCFIQGKELVDRIILNEPERLYKTGLP